jgi:DNA-binding beta-propeller fold protein YncE
LAWDGEYLWCADAQTDTVYQLDPQSGEIVSSFPFPIQIVHGGLAWGSDGNILIAYGSRVYIVDPANGGVVDRISCESG